MQKICAKVNNYIPLHCQTNYEGMKSSELDRRVKQSEAQFLYQDATSHKYYELNGTVFCVPFHGAKEVPTKTCKRVLKIIKGGRKTPL